MRITNDQLLVALEENSAESFLEHNIARRFIEMLDDSEDLQERIEMLASPIAHLFVEDIINREVHDLFTPEESRQIRRQILIWLLKAVQTEIMEKTLHLFCRQGITADPDPTQL